MTEKEDIRQYSLKELRKKRNRGETQTSPTAPTQTVDKDFWIHARVVRPNERPKVHTGIRLDADEQTTTAAWKPHELPHDLPETFATSSWNMENESSVVLLSASTGPTNCTIPPRRCGRPNRRSLPVHNIRKYLDSPGWIDSQVSAFTWASRLVPATKC